MEKRQLCLDFYNLKTSGDELIPDQSMDSITINDLGFRGAEFSEIKPPNTHRTFMIGGSTMFGAGATSDNTTIPGYVPNSFWMKTTPSLIWKLLMLEFREQTLIQN